LPDLTQEVLAMQVQMEVSRRFFNIMAADLLSRSIKGVQIPDIKRQIEQDTVINTKQLMQNGRGISIQEMIELKREFDREWDSLSQREKLAKMKTHTDSLILKK
jgi:hypothetical protein